MQGINNARHIAGGALEIRVVRTLAYHTSVAFLVTKAKVPLSMWAVHACAEHPDTNFAEHTAIGLVRKTRGYGHRMCFEGNYYEVFRPSENKRAGGSYGINRLR